VMGQELLGRPETSGAAGREHDDADGGAGCGLRRARA